MKLYRRFHLVHQIENINKQLTSKEFSIFHFMSEFVCSTKINRNCDQKMGLQFTPNSIIIMWIDVHKCDLVLIQSLNETVYFVGAKRESV